MLFLTIHHRKGGVGKTTTVQNLALAFSQKANLKTLAIDLDPSGNLTSSFGMGEQKEKLGSADLFQSVLFETPFEISDYLLTPRKNLDLIAGSERLLRVQDEIFNYDGKRGEVLQKAIRSVKDSYSIILVDTSPLGGWLVNNALLSSKKVIIPVECETFSVDGLGALNKSMRELAKKNDTEIEVFGIVATRVNESHNSHKSTRKLLRATVGELLFDTVIHTSASIESAQNRKKSVLEYKPKARASLEYEELAKEILQRETENGRQ